MDLHYQVTRSLTGALLHQEKKNRSEIAKTILSLKKISMKNLRDVRKLSSDKEDLDKTKYSP